MPLLKAVGLAISHC